ncbi:MAG: PHP domain-containing protein [Cellvibrionales bacterium]|nr:PHP domain-containing protein [Cellvibrionales bacterium]
MKFDLHSHSTASDGKLSPEAMLELAVAEKLSLFALTDHDSIQGFRIIEALKSEKAPDLTLVPGIEFSSQWSGVGIHVVGLDFDPDHPVLQEGIAAQGQRRADRAITIGKKLEKLGMPGVLDKALALSGDAQKVGRPHFARAMVDAGFIKSVDRAFKQYLGDGKACDVKSLWPKMSEVIEWIIASGGVPVLAHPLKYKMTRSKRERLLTTFKDAGGQAVEVTEKSQDPAQHRHVVSICERLGLAGSGGSDFHGFKEYTLPLGHVDPIPSTLVPIWQLFNHTPIPISS